MAQERPRPPRGGAGGAGLTLVVQSCAPGPPGWVERCLASVQAWAGHEGFAYERLGDELFDLVPPGLSSLGRLPAADVARLALLRRRLDDGHDAVLWLDADVLVFAPERVPLPDDELCACRELWVTGAGDGELRAVPYVCNAALLARAPGGALDALYAATVERASDAARPVQDRSLGPDLLTVLDRAAPTPLLVGVSLLSPHVVRDLAAGGGPAVDLLRAHLPEPIGGANLCASTGLAEAVFEAAVDALASGEHGLD